MGIFPMDFGGMTPDSQPTVCVALGSNLGNPADTVRRAMGRLESLAASGFRCSSLWESSPVDCPPGSPRFINAAVLLVPHPGETPESFLGQLQNLEREFGRRPKVILNEPRPLDLDLIAWGSEVRNSPTLILPHPRAHQRRFVLEPLAELAPDLLLPGQTVSVQKLLADLPPDPTVRRID
jgi:2-amino-4-hydroxy-6-hydroxymethyldihydropteridine diphosphokinase